MKTFSPWTSLIFIKTLTCNSTVKRACLRHFFFLSVHTATYTTYIYQYCACAHGRGARPLPKQLLAHLRVRAAESCCSLLQVHASEAKKRLGRCFRLLWNVDRRLGFNKVSPMAYFSGGLYYRNSTVKRACLITVCTYFRVATF